MRHLKIIIWAIIGLLQYNYVFSAERADIDGLRYEYLKYYQGYGYVTVYGYTSSIPEDLIIPNTIKHKNIHNNVACYVSEIATGAFRGCSILKRIDTNLIEEIKNSAFENCTSLQNVSFGSLKRIGSKAFTGCTALDTLNYASGCIVAEDAFDESTYQNAKLRVDEKYWEECNNHEVWSKFQNKITQYSISVKVTGGGSVYYNDIIVNNNESKSLKALEKSSITLSFFPGGGHNLANLIIDGEDVTSKVINNQYTIENVSKSMDIQVSFYSITIIAKGNGHILCKEYYNKHYPRYETEIGDVRNGSHCFFVPTATDHVLRFYMYSDDGSHLVKVLKDETDITSQVDSLFLRSVDPFLQSDVDVRLSATLEFTFEKIPPKKYTLSIKSIGHGFVSFNDTDVRDGEKIFSIEEATSPVLSFEPDAGYKIKSVKMNGTDVTSSVINNRYTINNIIGDTSIEVEFEVILHTLTINSSGFGEASYNGVTVRDETQNFNVPEGTSSTITFTPDAGYSIANVKRNGTDVTASVTKNKYTIDNISADESLSVSFEVTPTYTLTITASGNGSVYFNNTTVRNKTEVFSINGSTDAIISFTTDAGYRIKSVKVNDSDVTLQVSNGQLSIGNIRQNTNVEVIFEAIPLTTYALTVSAIGNGAVIYDGNTIKGKTSSFTVVEGSNVVVQISADAGNRLKSVKLNNVDVTSSVVDNQYTIKNVKANTTLEVLFESIPTYSLNITASGNGSVTYNGTYIRGITQTFTVSEGTSATLSFTPDAAYRIASVKVNNTDVTANVINNSYTISKISTNTTLSVTFEAITHSLTIKATGNGCATYNETMIQGMSTSFTVNEGTSAIVKFTPDAGYMIKSVKLNTTNITSLVKDNEYTISNINCDIILEVEFEAIIHTLNIVAVGNGNINYNGAVIRNQSQSYSVQEGSSIILSFAPDAGYRVANVKLNNTDATASVANNNYTISNIMENTTLTVTFEEIPPTIYTFTISAIGNGTVTYEGNAVKGNTFSFTVVEGTNAVVKFTADEGNRLKSVQLDNIDVTSSVVDNQYVIKNIKANTSLEVTFEAIPTYSLNITVMGNGSVIYNGTSVRGKTQTFTVSEGTSATVTFAPEAGYRIASVMLNNTDVTASVANNSFTINKITANTTLAVTFEEIPPTTYTFAISAIGNGTVTYDENTIRSKTISFTVIEGTNAIVKFTADEGYRLKSVKLNNIDVTSSVVNNQYSINNIKENMTLEVIFEPIPTYLLNLSASGSGQVEYNGKTIRNQSQSFTLMEGSLATISLTPDSGHRIASVKLNGEDVTTQVSNGQISISSITANTNVAVAFEAIPPTSYSLSITAIGNGYVAYDGNTVRSKTSSFTVIEGTNATVKFSADEGNRLKGVKVNHVDVTASVTGNQYTIIDIKADTSVEVIFEAIPTYSLNIVSSGNGSASYDGTIIRNQSQSFTLQEGSSAVVSFMADAGCRIKSVKVNSNDVTAQVSNGQITIDNITQNTNVEVSFEEIPPTTYSLTISAVGNGTVVYDSHTVKDQTSSFTVVEGSYITIQIVPDDGYRMKSVTLDGMDVTANVADGQYTTSKMMANATLIVEFEAVPTYSLTIKASAFGSVKYGDAVVSNRTETFSIREGTAAVLAFMPDDNGRMQRITLNGADITKELVNGQYTIGNIRKEQIVEAEFVEDITKVMDAGVAYTVTSYDEQTVIVATGNYGNMLTIPASFSAKGMIWKVVGIDEDALIDNKDLAAVIWKPEVMFDAKISNPNLLLYVKAAQYAASGIQNVVVGDVENVESLVAENIVLAEAESGNDFYCPVPFMAKRISYEHNYSMISGYKTCQGWETIALPFDVSIITNAKGTEIVPYSTWEYGSNLRPFWLYELTPQGWKASNGIKANVPYIISMPNNEMYDSDYNQTGNIRFIGNNVQIVSSDNMTIGQYGNKRLVTNYQNLEANADIYALNVSNEWYQNTETEKEGSTFIRSLRAIHPFEAYMSLESGAAAMRAIPIFENDATGISDVQHSLLNVQRDVWYSIDGRKLQGEPKQKGIYIYNGKKVRK